MASWSWTLISVIIVFPWVFLQLLTQNNKNKKLPPGPKPLPIIGHFHLLGKNLHRDLHRLSTRHGPIMHLRLGSVPAVVVSSPAAAELFLKTRDIVFSGRPRHQASDQLSYGQRDILFAPYGPYWRNMRKLCTLELLSGVKIRQFSPARKAELDLLVDSLRRAGENRETVDLSAGVAGLIGDMICLMVFGRKFDDRELDEKGFKAVIEETMQVAATPNLGDYFPLIGAFDIQGLKRRMKELSKTFDGFLERIIDDHVRDREEKKEEARDFVDTMMAIMESGEAGFEFDRRHVKAVLLDMLVGGMDTSAAAVDWVLAELIRHPNYMNKLQEELREVIGMDKKVDESLLDKLKYLDSVITETLRLHPIGPLLIHESLEDCTVDEFLIPKGSWLIVNVWSIGRDPSAWGEDPEEFNPERFAGAEIDLRGHDFRLLPFGSGRRGCPGQQLGLTVLRLVVAQLVHCFDWELPDGSGGGLDMGEHFGMVTAREKCIMAVPTYRLHK